MPFRVALIIHPTSRIPKPFICIEAHGLQLKQDQIKGQLAQIGDMCPGSLTPPTTAECCDIILG